MQVEGLAKKEVLMGGTEKHRGEILVGVSRAQEQHSKSPASPAACAGTHKWDSPREKEKNGSSMSSIPFLQYASSSNPFNSRN